MPPVTTHARVQYSPKPCTEKKVKANLETINQAAPQRRKPKSSPKAVSKHSPKHYRKRSPETNKQDVPKITYDKNTLLSLRDSPLSMRTPSLPSIPGVTAPRLKEPKEIPLSLRIKLQKRGVEIIETPRLSPNITAQQDSDDVLREVTSLDQSNKLQSPRHEKLIWKSCMYHLV